MNAVAIDVVVCLAATVVTIALTARYDVVSDEAWMLVVADRVQSRSDVLYRDVFFGVAPLPLWLLLAGTRRGGVEIAVLRRMNGVCTGVLTAALWSATHSLGLPWWCSLVVAVVTVLGCGPVADLCSWYENLSRAGVALALCLVLDGRPWSLIAAGIAVGISVMSKYTVGLVTAPALIALAWTAAHDRRWLLGGIVGGLVVVGVSLAPLARQQGALRFMVHRLGRGKRSFVQHGRISLWGLVLNGAQPVRVMSIVVPFTVVALPATLWAWRDGAPLIAVWAVVTALAAFWSCTWPRADSAHLRSGLPFATVAVLVATEAVNAASPSAPLGALRIAMACWAGWLAVAGVRYAVHRGALRARPTRQVRGCSGAGCKYGDPMLHDLWVASELAGGVALVLGVDAPLVSLVSGIHNPTAYDYPLASAFGVHGQSDVAARIRDGRVAWVVEVDPMPTNMAPAEVDSAVAEHTEIVWQSHWMRLRRSLASR